MRKEGSDKEATDAALGRGMVEGKSSAHMQSLAASGNQGVRIQQLVEAWPGLTEAARDRLFGMLLAYLD